MFRGIYTAANGMIAQSMMQDALANNLANEATPGFKRSSASVGAFPWQVVALAGPAHTAAPIGTGALVDRTSLDWSAGELQEGGPTSVAIVGEGFFAVQGDGETLYSRAGDFHVTGKGILVDGRGRAALGSSGVIRLSSGGPVRLGADGSVYEGDTVVGKLQIYRTGSGTTVTAVEGGAYRVQGPIAPAADARLVVGQVEGSNVDPIQEMTALLAVARTYEGSRQAFRAEDEAAQHAVGDIGKF